MGLAVAAVGFWVGLAVVTGGLVSTVGGFVTGTGGLVTGAGGLVTWTGGLVTGDGGLVTVVGGFVTGLLAVVGFWGLAVVVALVTEANGLAVVAATGGCLTGVVGAAVGLGFGLVVALVTGLTLVTTGFLVVAATVGAGVTGFLVGAAVERGFTGLLVVVVVTLTGGLVARVVKGRAVLGLASVSATLAAVTGFSKPPAVMSLESPPPMSTSRSKSGSLQQLP